MSAYVCLRVRVRITEEDIDSFCLSRSSQKSEDSSEGSSLSMDTTYMFLQAFIRNWSAMRDVEGNWEM